MLSEHLAKGLAHIVGSLAESSFRRVNQNSEFLQVKRLLSPIFDICYAED